jgi:hypothetical protein
MALALCFTTPENRFKLASYIIHWVVCNLTVLNSTIIGPNALGIGNLRSVMLINGFMRKYGVKDHLIEFERDENNVFKPKSRYKNSFDYWCVMYTLINVFNTVTNKDGISHFMLNELTATESSDYLFNVISALNSFMYTGVKNGVSFSYRPVHLRGPVKMSINGKPVLNNTLRRLRKYDQGATRTSKVVDVFSGFSIDNTSLGIKGRLYPCWCDLAIYHVILRMSNKRKGMVMKNLELILESQNVLIVDTSEDIEEAYFQVEKHYATLRQGHQFIFHTKHRAHKLLKQIEFVRVKGTPFYSMDINGARFLISGKRNPSKLVPETTL